MLSASDPLNLVGIILPGERVSALSKQQIILRGGTFVGFAHVNEKGGTLLRPIVQKQTPLRTVKEYW